MKTKVISILFAGLAFSNASYADYVENVYSCGDDIGLRMRDAGWVVVLKSDVGEKRVDRIMSIGLTLLTSGKQTGYFDVGQTISWCGIPNTKKITVLSIGAP